MWQGQAPADHCSDYGDDDGEGSGLVATGLLAIMSIGEHCSSVSCKKEKRLNKVIVRHRCVVTDPLPCRLTPL